MNKSLKIPFCPNLTDGTHCYQAALKMVLTALTQKEWSYQELDQITGKLQGQWTWPTLSLIWLLDNNFEVQLIEEFEYEEFGKKGKEYLVKKWGEEVAKAQETHSDLRREQKLALEFARRSKVHFRVPTWNDLNQLFKDGYLVICNINANLLFGHSGYSGHFIVPTEISEKEIILHDPGLPPAPFMRVARNIFEKAWGYPTKREKNVLGIRKKITA